MRALVLAAIPFAVGIAVAIALWGEEADPIFFSTAAEVIALGAVAMALQGGVFRLRSGGAAVTVPILIAIGTGLAFAFGALGRADGGAASHMAMTAAALAMGASAFALHAVFGIVPDVEEPATPRRDAGAA